MAKQRKDDRTPDLFGADGPRKRLTDDLKRTKAMLAADAAKQTVERKKAIANMTIPDIRHRLHLLADKLRDAPNQFHRDMANEIAELAEATKRRTAVRKASPRRRNPTPTRAAEIRAYAERHPNMLFDDIGRHFNVSSGRISEALAGKRGEVPE